MVNFVSNSFLTSFLPLEVKNSTKMRRNKSSGGFDVELVHDSLTRRKNMGVAGGLKEAPPE